MIFIMSENFNWRRFLSQWSRDFISYFDVSDQLPENVISSQWLGYPAATEEQIRCAEARLEISLPPSYREFLKVTNGWRQTTPFIYRLWSVEEIEWFVKRHSSWIMSFTKSYIDSHHPNSHLRYQLNGSLNILNVPDSEYFLYGQGQDCSKLRLEYLSKSLEISAKGESAIYLLNPQVISEDGEWEAWFFSDWLPGADRYRSFQELMIAEHRNFLEMQDAK